MNYGEGSHVGMLLGTGDLGWGVDVVLAILFILIAEAIYIYWSRKDTFEEELVATTIGKCATLVASGIILVSGLFAIEVLAAVIYHREHLWLPFTVVGGLTAWILFNNKIVQPYMANRYLKLKEKEDAAKREAEMTEMQVELKEEVMETLAAPPKKKKRKRAKRKKR